MLSASYNTRLRFTIVTCAISLFLFLWSRDTDSSERTSFLVLNSKLLDSIPAIPLHTQNNSDTYVSFVETVKQKYGNVRFSGICSVNDELNTKEEEMYRTCVDNGPRDRVQNGSLFWKTAQIRCTHHSYLSKEDAVLMEVGGNQGSDASQFVRLYNPKYLILEPLEKYANLLTEKFKENERVTVLNLGLGAKNEVVMVKIKGINACATSKFSSERGETPLYVTNATEFLLKIGVGLFNIDLFTMNCEGCEFEVLETLLSTNLVNHLRNIQFATHSTIRGLEKPIQRYCRIQQLLHRTHRPTYQYKFIWESWRRKDLP